MRRCRQPVRRSQAHALRISRRPAIEEAAGQRHKSPAERVRQELFRSLERCSRLVHRFLHGETQDEHQTDVQCSRESPRASPCAKLARRTSKASNAIGAANEESHAGVRRVMPAGGQFPEKLKT